MPELCLTALAAAVLLPKLVGALSDPVLCLVGILFHIIVLPAFRSRKIRPAQWLIEGEQEILSINVKYFYISLSLKTCITNRFIF
jgi:hypothetical protein